MKFRSRKPKAYGNGSNHPPSSGPPARKSLSKLPEDEEARRDRKKVEGFEGVSSDEDSDGETLNAMNFSVSSSGSSDKFKVVTDLVLEPTFGDGEEEGSGDDSIGDDGEFSSKKKSSRKKKRWGDLDNDDLDAPTEPARVGGRGRLKEVKSVLEYNPAPIRSGKFGTPANATPSALAAFATTPSNAAVTSASTSTEPSTAPAAPMTPPTKPSVRPIPLGGKTDEDKKNFLLANTDAVFTTIPNDKIDDVSLKKFLAMFKNFTGYDASMEKVEKNIIKTRLMAFIQSGAEPEYHLKFAPKAVPVPYPVTAPAPAPAPSSEPEQESSFTAAATTAVTATAAALASPSGFADSATFSPSPVTAATSVAASPLKAHSLSPVYDKAARKQKKKDEKIRRKEEKRLRKLEKEAKRTAKKAAKKAAAKVAVAPSEDPSEPANESDETVFDGDAEESDVEDAPASSHAPRTNRKKDERKQRMATLAEARKKYLSQTERSKQAAAQAVLEEEMVTNEFTEEENKKMEEIQAIFDTNTDERLETKDEDHRLLIEKLKRKHEPVKKQLYEQASKELTRLKEEARRRRDEKKAKEEAALKPKPSADIPMLGRAFNNNNDNDVDLSSDSDFEFEAEDAPAPLGPTYSSSTAKAPRLSLTTAKSFPIASRKVIGHSSKRNKIKELLRVKTRAKGNEWLANELEYTSVDDHINDCKIVEVRRREKDRRDELKEEAEKAEREKMRAAGKNFGEGDGNAGNEEMDEEEMIMKKVDEADDEESEDEEVVEDIATQMAFEFEKEATEDMEVEENRVFDIGGATGKAAADELLAKTKAEVGIAAGKPVEDGALGDTEAEATEQAAVNAAAEAEEDNNLEKSEVAPGAHSALSTSSPTTEVEATTTSTANANNDNDSEEEFDADAADAKEPPKKDRAAAYKAMLLKDAENAKKKKRMKAGINSLVEDEADEEEEEDAVAGLEDFGFGTKKKEEEDEDKTAGLDTITADDLENIVDTFSDDEGDQDEGNKKRAEQAAKEEKKRHKEMMRRMKEGYDGRRHGTAGAARGGLDWNALVAADGKKDAKRLGLLNSDEEDSDAEKDDVESEEEDELALLDRVLKERHNPRNQLAMQLADSSDSESESDDDGAERGEDEEAEREQAKEEERLAKRIAKRAKMQRVLAEFGGDSQSHSMFMLPEEDEDEMKRDLGMIKTSKKKGGFMEEFGGGEESQSNFASNLGIGGDTGSKGASQDDGSSLFSRLSKPPLNKRKADTVLNDSTNSATHLQRGMSGSKSGSSSGSALNVNGALAMALKASRKVGNKKFKSSFLGKDDGSSLGRSSSAGNKAIALGHVLFDTGSRSAFGGASNAATTDNMMSEKIASRDKVNTITPGGAVGKPNLERSGSSSLWSKISKGKFH